MTYAFGTPFDSPATAFTRAMAGPLHDGGPLTDA
jgi:hypothetical protein